MYFIHKRCMLMLEVLIAMAIVALCLLPLISPHVLVYKSQKEFTHSIQMARKANELFGEVLERLHKNEIPWQAIQERHFIPLDDLLSKTKSIKDAYRGTYQFTIVGHKENPETGWGMHLLNLAITVGKGENSHFHTFDFSIPLIRHIQTGVKQGNEERSTKNANE